MGDRSEDKGGREEREESDEREDMGFGPSNDNPSNRERQGSGADLNEVGESRDLGGQRFGMGGSGEDAREGNAKGKTAGVR